MFRLPRPSEQMSRAEAEGTEPGGEAVAPHHSGRVGSRIAADGAGRAADGPCAGVRDRARRGAR